MKRGIAIQVSYEYLKYKYKIHAGNHSCESIVDKLKSHILANLGIQPEFAHLVDIEASKKILQDLVTFRISTSSPLIQGKNTHLFYAISETAEYPLLYDAAKILPGRVF